MTVKTNARLDNFKILVSEIEDTFQKAIARYRVPYKNGEIIEDTGLRARVIRLRTYWMKDNYDAHEEFLDHLAEKGPYELTHPKYGFMRGCIDVVSVRHNRLKRTADIDITFIEDNFRGIPEPKKYTDVEAGTEGAWIDGQDELQEEIVNDMAYEAGPYSHEISTKELDSTKPSFFEQFSGLSRQAAGYVKKVDQYVRTLQAQCNVITNPANSLLATVTYTQNLPGLLCQTIAQAVERYALLASSLVSFPDRFISVFTEGTSSIINSTRVGYFQKYGRVMIAHQCAVSVGGYFKTDELRAQEQRRLALTPAFDDMGKPTREITAPERILTVTEIERVLGDVRTLIQSSVNEARSIQSLKAQAAVLMEYAIRIKTTRGAIIDTNIESPLPLHLICLQYGLPYNDAEQILAANSNIRHPSFVTGGISIYGR